MLGNLVCSPERGKHFLLLDMNLENERLILLQCQSVSENGSDTEDGEPRDGERNQGLEKALESNVMGIKPTWGFLKLRYSVNTLLA